VIGGLAKKAVQKIAGPESASDQGSDPSTVGGLYAHVVADVHEYVRVTQRDKREFAKVRVCTEVLEGVHGLPKKTISFMFVLFLPLGAMLPA
jgi:hypothetical protein